MLKLLFRTIGLNFYQQHAGLFLVILYILFGAVEGSQLISYHRAILMAICTSPVVLAILFIAWILYVLKALFFVKNKLNAPEYRFLIIITTLSRKQQYLIWFGVYTFLMGPILAYLALILITALHIGSYLTLFVAPVGVFVLLISLCMHTFRVSNFTFTGNYSTIRLPRLKVKRPFWSWPMFYLFHEQRILLIAVKIVSVFFFKAVLFMFADVGNDVRVYQTAMLAVTFSHAVLVFNLVKFNASFLAFAKTLPFTAFKNLTNSALVYLLVLIPEYILLGWLTGFDRNMLWQCTLFGMAVMLAMQFMVYQLKADMDKYLKTLLLFFFATMMCILAGWAMLYSLGLILIAGLLFLWYYPKIDFKTIA